MRMTAFYLYITLIAIVLVCNASPPGPVQSTYSSHSSENVNLPLPQIHQKLQEKEFTKIYTDDELYSLPREARLELAHLFDSMKPPLHDPLLMSLYAKVRSSSDMAFGLAMRVEKIYANSQLEHQKQSLYDEFHRYKKTIDERGVIYHLILNSPTEFTKFYGIKHF